MSEARVWRVKATDWTARAKAGGDSALTQLLSVLAAEALALADEVDGVRTPAVVLNFPEPSAFRE